MEVSMKTGYIDSMDIIKPPQSTTVTMQYCKLTYILCFVFGLQLHYIQGEKIAV